MACKLDKDCVFGDQQPDCDRVQICCKEKLAVKDEQIADLTKKLRTATDLILESVDKGPAPKKQLADCKHRRREGRITKNGPLVRLCYNDKCCKHMRVCNDLQLNLCQLREPK